MADDVLKQRADVDIDWLESTTLILNDKGELDTAGTVIKITNTLIFLKPLTNDQLVELKNTINTAIEHELKTRKRLSN